MTEEKVDPCAVCSCKVGPNPGPCPEDCYFADRGLRSV